jgi:hypothetical protein
MELDYWILNADSFLHQIFMIVMGILQAMAYLVRVSYEAMNIYCYFILYPLTFALFLKTSWKYLFLPVSLLFFLIPGFESISAKIFLLSVDFLNWTAEIFNSDYITMSVYICVLVPVILYLPFIILKFSKKQLKFISLGLGCFLLLYMLLIYPYFQDMLVYAKENYAGISP